MRRASALLLAERIKRATMRTQPAGMFHRFTDRARRAVHLAQEEARLLRHDYVGTEHLLLALLRDSEGVAARVLTGLGADHAQIRERTLGLLAAECEQADPQTRPAAELADTAEQLARVRRHKEAAFGAGDLGAAAALRDRGKQLLADKLRLDRQLTLGAGGQAIIAENQRLRRELDRLRDLLHQHGIEPDTGAARTA